MSGYGFFFDQFKISIGSHPYIQYAFASYVNSVEQAKQARDSHAKWGVWGWYIVLDTIAEGDRFGGSGMSKMEGALRSNFYEAMIWVGKQRHIMAENGSK